MDQFFLSLIEINILLVYLSFIDSSLFEVKILLLSISSITALFSDYFLLPKNNPNDILYTVETFFIVLFRLSFLLLITIVLIDKFCRLFPLSIVAATIILIYLAYSFYHYGNIAYNNTASSILLYAKYSFFISLSTTILL